MKEYIVICLVTWSSLGFSQKEQKASFSVDVKEFAMGMDFNYYISSDSIYVVKKSFLPKESKERFSYRWSEQEKSEIKRNLRDIPLQRLKTSYHRADAVNDDDVEFIFHFNVDGYEKKVEVYGIKVRSIADFNQVVNKVLPERYRIGYNDKYFSR